MSDKTTAGDRFSDFVFVTTELYKAPRRRRELRNYFLKLGEEYDAAEPFIKVARLEAPRSFEWSGSVPITFAHRQVPGDFEVRWDTGSIRCKHTYDGAPDTNQSVSLLATRPTPGKIMDLETFGSTSSSDGTLRVDGIIDLFEPLLPGRLVRTFSARRLERRLSADDIAFTRYNFLGVHLPFWRHNTERFVRYPNGDMSAPGKIDSDDATLFNRRCRITEASKGDHPSSNIIAITVTGPPLEEEQREVLRHVVSFVAGARAQQLSEDWYNVQAEYIGGIYLDSAVYGPTKSPPFDMIPGAQSFSSNTWTVLCDGFAKMILEGYPLVAALHHLHDSNSGWYETEIKNLLFCIHSLFEKWADLNKQRITVKPEGHFKKAERLARACIQGFFGFCDEACRSAISALHYANNRDGSTLQGLFFDSLGVVLSPYEAQGLRLRNQLFHNGYIKHDVHSQAELQEVLYKAGALRTLAHIAILKLAGYNGWLYDWQTYSNRLCLSDYPPEV